MRKIIAFIIVQSIGVTLCYLVAISPLFWSSASAQTKEDLKGIQRDLQQNGAEPIPNPVPQKMNVLNPVRIGKEGEFGFGCVACLYTIRDMDVIGEHRNIIGCCEHGDRP